MLASSTLRRKLVVAATLGVLGPAVSPDFCADGRAVFPGGFSGPEGLLSVCSTAGIICPLIPSDFRAENLGGVRPSRAQQAPKATARAESQRRHASGTTRRLSGAARQRGPTMGGCLRSPFEVWTLLRPRTGAPRNL